MHTFQNHADMKIHNWEAEFNKKTEKISLCLMKKNPDAAILGRKINDHFLQRKQFFSVV